MSTNDFESKHPRKTDGKWKQADHPENEAALASAVTSDTPIVQLDLEPGGEPYDLLEGCFSDIGMATMDVSMTDDGEYWVVGSMPIDPESYVGLIEQRRENDKRYVGDPPLTDEEQREYAESHTPILADYFEEQYGQGCIMDSGDYGMVEFAEQVQPTDTLDKATDGVWCKARDMAEGMGAYHRLEEWDERSADVADAYIEEALDDIGGPEGYDGYIEDMPDAVRSLIETQRTCSRRDNIHRVRNEVLTFLYDNRELIDQLRKENPQLGMADIGDGLYKARRHKMAGFGGGEAGQKLYQAAQAMGNDAAIYEPYWLDN